MSIEILKEALQEAAEVSPEFPIEEEGITWKKCAYEPCGKKFKQTTESNPTWGLKKFCCIQCQKDQDNERNRAKKKAKKKDSIKAPAKLPKKSGYYDAGGLSTLDIIKAKLTPEQYKGFLLGCVLKYGCRMNHKGQDISDSDKTAVYAGLLRDLMGAEVKK